MHKEPLQLNVTRLLDQPILHVDDDQSHDGNINGPSLIRVPSWIENPLARYYLYFSHHEGDHIRMAYADNLRGPWTLYEGGVLSLHKSHFPITSPKLEDLDPRVKAYIKSGADGLYPHIASPDVIVDASSQSIRLYYHGRMADGIQTTRVATSEDGLHFDAHPQVLGRSYFRVIRYNQWYYALAMPGVVYRSKNGLVDFESGNRLFNDNMRHSALFIAGETLYVFWTQVGDTPERILLSKIDLTIDWKDWQEQAEVEILRPQTPWEGALEPVLPSKRGSVMHPVNEIHDPGIYSEEGKTYLLYSVAGEQGIGIARITGFQ
jgi:hypothetical protein